MMTEVERLKAIIVKRNAQIARFVAMVNEISDQVATIMIGDDWSKDEVEDYLLERLQRIDEVAVYGDEDIKVVRPDIYPDIFEEL